MKIYLCCDRKEIPKRLTGKGYELANFDGQTLSEYMNVLLSCEAIYLSKNWKQSEKSRISKAIAEEMGKIIIYENEEVPVEKIEQAACKAWNIKRSDLYKKSTKRAFSDPRKAVFYYRIEILKHRDREIEQETGFDRCTIRYNAERGADLLTDRTYSQNYRVFLQMINN